jgi:immune inhibitor A
MKIVVKQSALCTFTAWLLTVAIFTASISIPVSAQTSLINDDAVSDQIETDNESAPEGLSEDEDGNIIRGRGDDFKSPQASELRKLREEALKQKLAGKKSGKVHQVAKGQFVELELEKNDRVFVIIAEYGDKAGIGTTAAPLSPNPGPAHNNILEPNRELNNSTIWQKDYNSDHYRDMYFNKMRKYYETQSSGRYTINGDVTEWVKVPFNGSRYGANSMGDRGAWTFIADAINTWTQAKLASGMTLEEVTAYLKTFDVADRYDYDKDGVFNEPDGYIDHFQIVHAGDGEETGGGVLGADAIWSHRWFAWSNRRGVNGPSFFKNGGVEFGGGYGANPNGGTVGSSGSSLSSANPTTTANVTYAYPVTSTGIFVGDYTIQPENGGLGVFAHEYGHDLGLPDQYDTAGGDNSTGFWTIMSSGSYLGDGHTDVGTRPGDFSAWDKLQLGWLNYDQATAGVYSEHKLGPAETNTKKAQALVIPLPPEKNDFFLYDPVVGKLNYGTKAYWGGMADNLDSNMTRTLAVPAGTSTLNMRLQYNIENNWDYAYVSVSNNGGATWTNLAGTYLGGTNGTTVTSLTNNNHLTTLSTGNKQNLGNGITGSSAGAWRLASFNMTPYAGQQVQLRLRYKTDENTTLSGILADEITFAGVVDGAENADSPWTMNGFKVTNGVEASNAPHYYIAEFRQYRTYDETLQTGPYTYGRIAPFTGIVDHYAYQEGLLITYWDTAQADNNTSAHRGEGRSIPIDAHPEPLRRVVEKGGKTWTFSPWTSRVQSYDATFGLNPTDALKIPFRGTLSGAVTDTGCMNPVSTTNTATPPVTTTTTLCEFWTEYPSQPGVPVFNDMNSYWSTATPAAGVIVPRTGTSIRIENTSARNTFMKVLVNGE